MIAWFAKNGVAANLLMIGIIAAGVGALYSRSIPIEVFPEIPQNELSVRVPYRAATPEEVEESIIIPIEEAIANIEGIKQIVSYATDSGGTVNIETQSGFDLREVLNDVKLAVDAIPRFPADAERPIVSASDPFYTVLTVVLHGDLGETDLRKLGEHIRDEIVTLPEVTNAELQGVRMFEVGIEIDEATLQNYGLTFDSVARALRLSAIDVPAGTLKTESGEIVLRTRGRAYNQEDFEKIVIQSGDAGQRVTLADVAQVHDGFDENPYEARYNGKPCVFIAVAREGNQSAIRLAEEVKAYLESARSRLPEGVGIDYWNDRSTIVRDRLNVLLTNAWSSGLLVFIVLSLFMRTSLALWVVLGIPVSFLGAIALMPFLGISISIVSLFAFVLVLGVVVDDAIVVADNIHTWQNRGVGSVEASIRGSQEVAVPVLFGVLTTMLAFSSKYIATNDHSRWQGDIASIVILVLFFSLVESKLILPYHLTHHPRERIAKIARLFLPEKWVRILASPYQLVLKIQNLVAAGLDWFVRKGYQPLLNASLRWRYLTASLFVLLAAGTWGYVEGGHIIWMPYPPVPSERVSCRVTLQDGTPYAYTEAQILRIEEIAEQMRKDIRGSDGSQIIEDIITSIGGQGISTSRSGSSGVQGESHLGEVTFSVTPPELGTRAVSSVELAALWRQRIGNIVGAKELTFRAEIFRSGDPIDLQINGQDVRTLISISNQIRGELETYAGVFDITDSVDNSNEELQLRLTPEARQFGLTVDDLARQVRQAFHGEEVQRIRRGRDEIRVMLRYPEGDRRTLATLDSMRVRTADGTEIPFASAAGIVMEKSFPRIQRVDRNRSVNLRADVDKSNADLGGIRLRLASFVDGLIAKYPGVTYTFEGEARDERDDARAARIGYAFVLFGLYVLLAIPFRSYIQPIYVMLAIPFGLIGAVIGHHLYGLPLSEMSKFGMIALSGVAVNDSLVLMDYINQRRAEGATVWDAVSGAGAARFRAVLLTSLTTFAGLYPLFSLKSTQSQFLIPMAVGLAFGVMFATFVTLFLVPVSVLIGEDVASLYRSRAPHPHSPEEALTKAATDIS